MATQFSKARALKLSIPILQSYFAHLHRRLGLVAKRLLTQFPTPNRVEEPAQPSRPLGLTRLLVPRPWHSAALSLLWMWWPAQYCTHWGWMVMVWQTGMLCELRVTDPEGFPKAAAPAEVP